MAPRPSGEVRRDCVALTLGATVAERLMSRMMFWSIIRQDGDACVNEE